MELELQTIILVATTITGFISFSKIFISVFKWVWVTFLRPPKNLKDYGSWALLTGATGGIGSALASHLASKGLNLILIDRDLPALQTTRENILGRYGSKVEVKYIVTDFLKIKHEQIVKKIEEEIAGLDVGLVINNAGIAYPSPMYFHEVDSKFVDSIIRVNMDGATWVTKAVLPAMMKKKRGAIVNIGSSSGSSSMFPSLPLYTLYAASKAYVAMLSKSMTLEYKQHGIDIQCQTPFFVATNLTPMRRPSFFVPTPEVFSKASVRSIGYESACVSYWMHYLQWCIHRAVPEVIFDKIIRFYILKLQETGVVKILGFEL